MADRESTQATGRVPAFGSWIIIPRQNDPLGLFDFAPRDPQAISPPAQEKLTMRVSEFLSEILDSDLDNDRKAYYIAEARRRLFKGCVQQKPRPEIALKEMDELESRYITRDLAIQLSREARVHMRLAAALLGAALAVALALRVFGQMVPGIDQVALSGVAIVWVGCMAAEIVSDLAVPKIEKIADYQRLSRMLSSPILRLIGSALGVEAVVAAVQNGAITLKLGNLDLTKAWENPGVAFFLGFGLGLLGSDVAKLLVSRLRKEFR